MSEKLSFEFDENGTKLISRIEAILGYDTKTQALGFAIRTTLMILDTIIEGREILVERGDGEYEKLVIKTPK